MLFLNILKNLNQILFFIFNFSIPSVFIDFNKKSEVNITALIKLYIGIYNYIANKDKNEYKYDIEILRHMINSIFNNNFKIYEKNFFEMFNKINNFFSNITDYYLNNPNNVIINS